MSFKRKIARKQALTQYKKDRKEYKQSISYNGKSFMPFNEYFKQLKEV